MCPVTRNRNHSSDDGCIRDAGVLTPDLHMFNSKRTSYAVICDASTKVVGNVVGYASALSCRHRATLGILPLAAFARPVHQMYPAAEGGERRVKTTLFARLLPGTCDRSPMCQIYELHEK